MIQSASDEFSDAEFYPCLMPADVADLANLLTYAETSGENATVPAVDAATDSPPVKENLQRARSVFVNIPGSADFLSMTEADEATKFL